MNHVRLAAMAAVFALMPAAPSFAADCKPRVAAFEAALGQGRFEEALAAERDLRADPGCAVESADLAPRRVAALLTAADAPGVAPGRREALLRQAVAPRVSWKASALLADVAYDRRQFAEALQLYEDALDLMSNRTLTPVAPSKRVAELVVGRAGAAKQLASDDDEGRKRGTFAPSRRGMRGEPAGVLSPELRAVVDAPVPLPIMFATGTATMTPDGEAAARELVAILKSDATPRITLIGHTDERGGDDYNMRLSEQRVKRVVQFLQQSGVTATVTGLAKGKTQPVDRRFAPPNATREELWALDRRVEFKAE